MVPRRTPRQAIESYSHGLKLRSYVGAALKGHHRPTRPQADRWLLKLNLRPIPFRDENPCTRTAEAVFPAAITMSYVKSRVLRTAISRGYEGSFNRRASIQAKRDAESWRVFIDVWSEARAFEYRR